MRAKLKSWFTYLSQPSDQLHNPDDRRRARLLAILTGMVCFPSILMQTIARVFSPNPNIALTISAALLALLLLVSYLFSRGARWQWGALLCVYGFVLQPFINLFILPTPGLENLIWALPGLVLGSLLLSYRGTILLHVVVFCLLLIMEFFFSSYFSGEITRPLILTVVNGSLLLVAARIRADDKEQIQRQTAQLHELNKDLGKKVVERTAELEKAKGRAEAANHAKDVFLASMSHELRTPLNAVIGYGQLITDYVDDGDFTNEELLKDVEHIIHSGSHLLFLVNQVLDLSLAQSDSRFLNLTHISLGDVLERVWSTAQVQVMDKPIDLVLDNEVDDSVLLYTDSLKLSQLIGNLISNAIKFTDEGAVTLAVMATEKEGVPHLSFCVTDTGIGISEEALEKIFSSFWQVENDYTRRYEGAGLGLTVCKVLCESLGGELSVESTEGVGSRFCAFVPVEAKEKEEKKSADLSSQEHVTLR